MLRLTLAFVLMSAPAAAETFTLYCHLGGYYVTFDTDTKRMAAESIEPTVYRGKIMSVSENVIVFHFLSGKDYQADETRPFSYLRKEGRLVAATKDENALYHCVPVATRDTLSKWDQLN
jgi:hypothetical protein